MNSFSNIQSWNIDEHSYIDTLRNECLSNNKVSNNFLLDLNKDNYSIIEKLVYDSFLFHCKQFNINNHDDYYVQFSWENTFDNTELHLQYHKENEILIFPEYTCLTYLCNNPHPTIITDIDLESYKYKYFNNRKNICLSIPTTNKQIIFDGQSFYGSTSLSPELIKDRFMLIFTVWKHYKPENIDFFHLNDNKLSFDKYDRIFTISKDNIPSKDMDIYYDAINYNFFNDILYNKKKEACYFFYDLIYKNKINDANYKFIFNVKDKNEIILLNKYGDIKNDYNTMIINKKMNTFNHNRFLQRFVYSNIYSVDMCEYIINECEKYVSYNNGWTTKRHLNYPTTDINVNIIPSIYNLILHSLQTVLSKIVSSYNLHKDISLDVIDLFVVKYSQHAQNHLEMHRDISFISFSILLNNNTEFEGGGTYFEDGLTTYLKQGELLIHSGFIRHSGLPVTKGVRYLLVGFLNIEFN